MNQQRWRLNRGILNVFLLVLVYSQHCYGTFEEWGKQDKYGQTYLQVRAINGQITNQMAQEIKEILNDKQKSIHKIYVAGKFEPGVIQMISSSLHENTALRGIDICSSSALKNEDGIAIAEALRRKSNLKAVYLCFDSIEDDGAKALAEAISSNVTLEVLEVITKNINDQVAGYFAAALSINKSLIEIAIEGVDANSLQNILLAIAKNVTLGKISISNFSENQHKTTDFILKRNKNVSIIAQDLRKNFHESLGSLGNREIYDMINSGALDEKLHKIYSLEAINVIKNFQSLISDVISLI